MAIKILIFFTVLLVTACSDDSTPSSLPTNITDQSQFLATNAARENVFLTETGLQYEVLRAASGPKPTADSTITVHYIGTLIDGTEFDNSYARGEPATFVLSGTIEGWIEGVQLMSVGSLYRFVIPAELAYADRGAGTQISPGDALVFEIDLLEINSN